MSCVLSLVYGQTECDFMIILKHLTVERFRLLREINLHFPQRGSILIQGPNEAGKSALLESIYFALYGEPLASYGGSTLDDLILYGTTQATITLTLAIGTTELSITRIIERGKGQQVTLHIHKPGTPAEPQITSLEVANERILTELGCLDRETLRNSSLIEQKELARLEHLAGWQRETSLRHLLGLDVLLSLTKRFTLTTDDEEQLAQCANRLKLAEIQAQLPSLKQHLHQLEEALDAVAITEDLAEINQQEVEIAEQEHSLQQIRSKRTKLKGSLGRIQQLKKADATLSEIIAAYDAMADARDKLPEIERQMLALEREEREELPALEKRVNELADLIRSFGTLERMSNDLLKSVNAVKELEQELQQQQVLHNESQELDEQVIEARLEVDQARQALNELEERRRAGRPTLVARLQRLRGLQKRLVTLHEAEEAYAHRFMNQELAEKNSIELRAIKNDILQTQQRLVQAENEVEQAQQQATSLERRLHQLNIRHQLEEWQRLKGLSQQQAETEQQVLLAHQNLARQTQLAVDAREASQRWLLFTIGSAVLALLVGITFLLFVSHNSLATIVLGIVALLLLGGAAYSYYSYNKVHKDQLLATQQMQEATNQVSTLVTARENAGRMNTNHEALAHVEQELRSLGSSVPRSREEAEHLIQQIHDNDEKPDELQLRMNEQHLLVEKLRTEGDSVREALAKARQEKTQLEALRTQEDWDDIENKLRSERIAIEDRQHEIATLAGQEGLPIPNFDHSASGPLTTTTNADLELALADSIRTTEREIASIDGRLDLATELTNQVRLRQEKLDRLLAQQRVLMERRTRFQTHDPVEQIELAREQQSALRTALQTLQDSLRQRIKPLGVVFGQTAISNAEALARGELEALHFALGQRVELQSQRAKHLATLKEGHDALADYYNQLARLSGSLGSWIMPPNPFTESLNALRNRCQREIQEANENAVQQELEQLQLQEGASNAKIELCHQDIAEAQERIATMLAQHNRPDPRPRDVINRVPTWRGSDVVTAWSLVGEYTQEDRTHLEEERATIVQEIQQQQEQALALSTELHTGDSILDVEQSRTLMEEQERNYQSKKYGSQLLQAVHERILHKMLPRTEYYMQQILPLLTSGRYRDVQLSTEEEEGSVSGGPFQLRVWDTAAGEYVRKSALSDGASNQLSLALRLAFAIAALPREGHCAPGFILLDEPLSAFDPRRTRALVDVVTGEALSQHFEQIVLVSHSQAFDAAMFPYHVYLDGGTVVESNLPVVPVAQVAGANGNGNSTDQMEEVTAKVPVPASGDY